MIPSVSKIFLFVCHLSNNLYMIKNLCSTTYSCSRLLRQAVKEANVCRAMQTHIPKKTKHKKLFYIGLQGEHSIHSKLFGGHLGRRTIVCQSSYQYCKQGTTVASVFSCVVRNGNELYSRFWCFLLYMSVDRH